MVTFKYPVPYARGSCITISSHCTPYDQHLGVVVGLLQAIPRRIAAMAMSMGRIVHQPLREVWMLDVRISTRSFKALDTTVSISTVLIEPTILLIQEAFGRLLETIWSHCKRALFLQMLCWLM